ncbi:hypothetical protein KK062_25780 [Fulvivirgaceae bacterium PWU5]|uniref:Uncharacterized protein n=1 Tax=Dawidia cretensis TaxID=2782350 RepID=A0AAP2E234_9BACT|nr:hypothetical protein [Dawidia cretensis]
MVYKHEAVQHADIKTFAGQQGFKKIRLILYTKPGNDLSEKQFKDWGVNRYGTKFLPAAVKLNPEGGSIKLMQN